MNLNYADYGVLYSMAKEMDLLTLLNFTYSTRKINRLLSNIWEIKLAEEFTEIRYVDFLKEKNDREKYITLRRVKEKNPALLNGIASQDTLRLDILKLGIKTMDFYLMEVGVGALTKVLYRFLDEEHIKEILKSKKIYPDFIIEHVKDFNYLEYLVKIKNHEGLSCLIKSEKSSFSISDFGKLLSLVCEKGMMEFAKYLVEERKCDVNFGNGDVLKSAVWSGNLELVKYLIDKGADINLRNCSYIKIASKKGYKEIFMFLENYIRTLREIQSGQQKQPKKF